jgi:hypothetical protein
VDRRRFGPAQLIIAAPGLGQRVPVMTLTAIARIAVVEPAEISDLGAGRGVEEVRQPDAGQREFDGPGGGVTEVRAEPPRRSPHRVGHIAHGMSDFGAGVFVCRFEARLGRRMAKSYGQPPL